MLANLSPSVGDVLLPDGLRPHLDMIASSHELDDRETEIVISRSAHHPSIQALFAHIQNRIGEIIRTVDGAYDQVIVDCAPGLSHVVWGAFRSADFVVVPYFPDQTAEDNVGWLCKRLDAIGLGHQYRTVANRVAGVDKRAPGIIGSIEAKYGTLGVQVPATQPLATALDFRTNPESLASKFGTSNKHVKDLTDAMLEWMNNSKKVAVA